MTEPSEILVQVRADGRGSFTAGMVVVEGVVIQAAPILRRWCLGKTASQARAIIASKGWKAVIVQPRRDR